MAINKNQTRTILGGLAVMSCILVLVLFPNNNDLNVAKEQLASADKRILQQKEDKQAILKAIDDLSEEETIAQERLQKAFDQVYGGIQTKEELEKNKVEIQKVLGFKLATEVWEDTYSEYGDKFFVKENIATKVGFQTGTGKTRKVLAMVTYKFEAPRKYTKLFELDYDLEKQRIDSYTTASLSVNRGGAEQ